MTFSAQMTEIFICSVEVFHKHIPTAVKKALVEDSNSIREKICIEKDFADAEVFQCEVEENENGQFTLIDAENGEELSETSFEWWNDAQMYRSITEKTTIRPDNNGLTMLTFWTLVRKLD